MPLVCMIFFYIIEAPDKHQILVIQTAPGDPTDYVFKGFHCTWWFFKISSDNIPRRLDPPILSRGPTKNRASGETDKLCIQNSCGVSILVTAPVAALIGESVGKPNYSLHIYHMNTLTDALRSDQWLWWSTSRPAPPPPRFWGNWNFSCKVRGPTRMTSLT